MKRKKTKIIIGIISAIICGIILLIGGVKLARVGVSALEEKIVEHNKKNDYKLHALEALKEKYGKDFEIKQLGGTFGANRNTRKLMCYPVDNPNDFFNVEVERDLSKVYDNYFTKVMEHKLEEKMEPYAKNLFGEDVIVKGGLDGMFQLNTDLDLTIEDYINLNRTSIVMDIFIKSDGNIDAELNSQLIYEFMNGLKEVFEDNTIKNDLGTSAGVVFYYVNEEEFNEVNNKYYDLRYGNDIGKYYYIEGNSNKSVFCEINDGKLEVDIEEIRIELE